MLPSETEDDPEAVRQDSVEQTAFDYGSADDIGVKVDLEKS